MARLLMVTVLDTTTYEIRQAIGAGSTESGTVIFSTHTKLRADLAMETVYQILHDF